MPKGEEKKKLAERYFFFYFLFFFISLNCKNSELQLTFSTFYFLRLKIQAFKKTHKKGFTMRGKETLKKRKKRNEEDRKEKFKIVEI